MIRTQTVVNVLVDLGITSIEQGDELWAQCPQHKERTGREDKNPSWSINKDTGAHFCFSCGYKGSLHNLVRDLRGDDAVKQLAADIETGNRSGEVDTKSNRAQVHLLAQQEARRARGRHRPGHRPLHLRTAP